MAYNTNAYVKVGTSLQRVNLSTHWNLIDGKPTNYPPTAHPHDASSITSGVLDAARIPSLPISKITSLQTELNSKLGVNDIPSVMSVSEGTTGTNTTQRTINAYNLKSIIDSSITTLANTIATDYVLEEDLSSHSSTKGTTSVYGHVRLINNLTTSSYSNGDALSAYQGYVLNSALNNKLSTSGTAYNSTRYNGYQMRIGAFSSGADDYITFSYE